MREELLGCCVGLLDAARGRLGWRDGIAGDGVYFVHFESIWMLEREDELRRVEEGLGKQPVSL